MAVDTRQEITPTMIEVGVVVVKSWDPELYAEDLDDHLREFVMRLYRAMEEARC